jgi:hypothetical protein
MKEVENESRKMGLDILNKLNTVDSGVVHTTGNETIAGTKTFTSSIVGNLTGNVTGNLTGNVTGNLTGNFLNTSGSNVASASTISTTGSVFHVTGTTAINTINIPYTGFTGSITIIPDAEFTFGTSDNIGGGQTYCAIANKPIVLTYDGTKWWPVASQDSGSNANGYYIRYSDGTMMQYAKISVSVTTTALGPVYRAITPISLALSFINTSFSFSYCVDGNTISAWGGSYNTVTTSSVSPFIYAASAGTATVTIYWQAIGKWK